MVEHAGIGASCPARKATGARRRRWPRVATLNFSKFSLETQSLGERVSARDFERHFQPRGHVGQLFHNRDFNNVFREVTLGIRVTGSLENGKDPKTGTALHYARCDQDVLVVDEINLVLPRNSLGIGQGKLWHLSVDSYVYRSLV